MGFTDLVGLHYWFKRCGANRQWLGAPEFVRQEAAVLQGSLPINLRAAGAQTVRCEPQPFFVFCWR